MITQEQIKIFKKSADAVYSSGDYTSATILYFKTWFAINDYVLLKRLGYSPKDHTERFKILKREIPEDYNDLDLEFSTYRDTYLKIISKDTCDSIKRLVENAIKKYKIE